MLALQEWTEIHPSEPSTQGHRQHKSFQAQGYSPAPYGCVYGSDPSHKSVDCPTLVTVTERKIFLVDTKLCFNCTGGKHRADKCKSRSTCAKCKRKHHRSICDSASQSGSAMTTCQGEGVCHPVVIVKVNNIMGRALLDTGSSSSYISSYLVELLNIKPAETVPQSLKTIVGLVTKNVEIYDVDISDTNNKTVLPVSVTKIDRREILTVENPEVLAKYPHLKGVHMEETATKKELPIHIILDAGEYTKNKMARYQRVGKIGEPLAEQTKFGWTIMNSSGESGQGNVFLAQAVSSDYKELCHLDVLGLQDGVSGDQSVVHEEFVEQLQPSREGWYETGLPWKGNLRHKENAGTTKMRIVYDASACAKPTAPSLNECLSVGPPLQNQLWKVIVCGRFHVVAIAGDIKKAFLQVQVRKEDRDALRFHWVNMKNPKEILVLGFTVTPLVRGSDPAAFKCTS